MLGCNTVGVKNRISSSPNLNPDGVNFYYFNGKTSLSWSLDQAAKSLKNLFENYIPNKAPSAIEIFLSKLAGYGIELKHEHIKPIPTDSKLRETDFTDFKLTIHAPQLIGTAVC